MMQKKKKKKKKMGCNVHNIVISILIETKNNSKCLIRYLDDVIRPLVLILPKMSGYVKTFKDKDGDKDKYKNHKLVSCCIDNNKLLEKHKTVWDKFEDLQSTELNSLPVYDNRYKKTKIRIQTHNIYTNFRGLNVSIDRVECEAFTIISIDSFFLY